MTSALQPGTRYFSVYHLTLHKRTFAKRLHCLGLTDHEIFACSSLPDLQLLAKRKYHALALRVHPDRAAHNMHRGRVETGLRLSHATDVMAWLMNYPERKWTRLLREEYEGSVEELPLPWHWTYARRLPWGYQITRLDADYA